MEQYANDKSPDRGTNPPEAETLLACGCLMEAANFNAF